MKRLLAILFLLCPALAKGAAGDITGVAIETNGWAVLVYISGVSTNGTYNFGLKQGPTIYAADNRYVWQRSGTEKLVLSVSSPGFDTNRTEVTRVRRLIGTKEVRLPYPDNADIDEVYDGTTLKLRIALDRVVYSGDSPITATIGAGLYTQGTASAAGSGLSVTNNSTVDYDPAIANWTWPGFQRETNSTMTLRAFGASPHALLGYPLAGLDFIVADEGGTTTTNAASFGIEPIMATMHTNRNAEYYAAIPLSGFAVTNRLKCDFRAYPWIGTTNEILDTRNMSWTAPHPWPGSITNLNDRTVVYSSAIAVVDPAGNDSNGRVTNAAPAAVNSAHYFLTIAGAANAIANTNNSTYGHADCGGGQIYVRAGITNWTGGTVSGNALNVPAAWAEVYPYPGDTVTLTSRVTSQDFGDRIKISGEGGTMNLSFTGTHVPFNNIAALWWDNLDVTNCTATAPLQGSTHNVVYVTRSRIASFTQGLVNYPGSSTKFSLLRDNWFQSVNGGITYFTFIGNSKTSTNGTFGTIRTSESLGLSADYSIGYNNRIFGLTGNNNAFEIGNELKTTNGFVFAQNVAEYCENNSGPNIMFINSDEGIESRNMMIWNNAVVGKRGGILYNATSYAKKAAHWFNNIWEIIGFKTDTFVPEGGTRVGNWEIITGANSSGNTHLERSIDSAAGSYPQWFGGFGTRHGGDNATGTNTVAWPAFADDKGFQGTVRTDGHGKYAATTSSPWVSDRDSDTNTFFLLYDIEGNVRDYVDPAGPYIGPYDPEETGTTLNINTLNVGTINIVP